MTRRHRFANDATTTLPASVSDSATVFSVANGAVFPTIGDFRIRIEEEIIIVTNRTGNSFTVLRGQEGTVAEAHASNAFVRAIVTGGCFDKQADDVTMGYSERIAHRILGDSANTLTSSDFTWVNQGGATVSDDPWGGITMNCPGATGSNLRILKRTALSTPYTLTAHVVAGPGAQDTCVVGLCLRESSSGKIIIFGLRPNGSATFGGTVVFRYDNPTTITTPTSTLGDEGMWHDPHGWIRVFHDSNNMFFRFSYDGINWWERLFYSRLSHFNTIADEFGLVVNAGASGDNQLFHFTSWLEE